MWRTYLSEMHEHYVALRVAVGVDLPLSDCEQLVALADTDGTGMVEFDEFRAICRQQL